MFTEKAAKTAAIKTMSNTSSRVLKVDFKEEIAVLIWSPKGNVSTGPMGNLCPPGLKKASAATAA